MNTQKDVCAITFAEKVKIFSNDFLKCCLYILSYYDEKNSFNKKLYSKFISTTQVLEDFLDFHGAKSNEKWYFYRELTATVKHISLGCYSQNHISNRLAFYDLPNIEEFKNKGQDIRDFLNQTLLKIAPVVINEAKQLKIPMPMEALDPTNFPSIATSEMLDYDIDDQDVDTQKKNIVKIANDFLKISESFEEFGYHYKSYTNEEILGIVPSKVNEVEIRQYEMLVHNLQSSFDTYVIHGGYRFGDRKIKRLRSFFLIVFHLLQMMGRLLHFYERHLYQPGSNIAYKNVHNKLVDIVNSKELLDYTINYGFFYVCHFLSTGKDLAREILNENMERSSIKVGIPEQLGFHCRPSLLVAKIVHYYGGIVELCVGSRKFDASSVLDMQWAGGMIKKENITKVVFKGDARALKDIEILAGVNYGEDIMGKSIPLPNELKYIK